MSKQTAVEWLVEKIIENKLIDVKNGHQFIHLQSIAKEMEKEQIIKAYDESNKLLCLKCTDFITGIKYYNQTFKKITK